MPRFAVFPLSGFWSKANPCLSLRSASPARQDCRTAGAIFRSLSRVSQSGKKRNTGWTARIPTGSTRAVRVRQSTGICAPGAYTFRLRARTGPRENNQVEIQLPLFVASAWWQSAWFIVLLAITVLSAVTLGVRALSTRRLRRRLQDLERQHTIEQERARIAQNIHDDVGASLTQISLLTQTALTNNSPEKLRSIHETARDITRSLDEIVWAVNPRNDTLESFGDYLGSQAQRFLQAAGIRCRLEILPDLPALPLASQTRHSLFLCCREALHNIVKHSGASLASVGIVVDGRILTICIQDDGCGIGDCQTEPAPVAKAGSGNGLRNMRDRMHSLGGTFTFSASLSGKGSCVTFILPLQ